MGYMIECPNLVFVNNYPVLIFCPQGLDKSVADYKNIYPNMYWIGKDINLSEAKFTPLQDHPANLDDGFDVYALKHLTHRMEMLMLFLGLVFQTVLIQLIKRTGPIAIVKLSD